MECDKALENGGFAAAREGVDDMDRGARSGNRGQSALLVLVDDFQRGRQGSEDAATNSATHGIPDTPVAGLACHTQSRADRATKRSLRMPPCHERRAGRPGVVQDQNNGLAEVIRGWCEDQTAGHTVRPWGVLHNVQSACLPDARRGRTEAAEAVYGDPPHQATTPSARASGSAGRHDVPSDSGAAKPTSIWQFERNMATQGAV